MNPGIYHDNITLYLTLLTFCITGRKNTSGCSKIRTQKITTKC